MFTGDGITSTSSVCISPPPPPAAHVALLPATVTGGVLLLQDLLLLNVSLASPSTGNPSTAFLPTSLALPVLKLRDVIMTVSQDTLQAYVAFLQGVADTTLVTDNTTFLHVRNYSATPFAAVEARALTLIAPRAAPINGTPLGLLQQAIGSGSASSGPCSSPNRTPDSQQQQQLLQQYDPSVVQAACGDAAGVVTVTDSYVLGVTNATFLQLMQQLAGGDEDANRQPVLALFATNITLAPNAWGSDWPAGGVAIRKPVVWVGSSQWPTSIDFGMALGQVRAG